jgi:hypothetical protein
MKRSLLFLAAVMLPGCLSNTDIGQNQSASAKLMLENNSGGGNGDYYGGKPEPGIYSRIDYSNVTAAIPCRNGSAIVEKIQITNDGATLTKRDPATCEIIREDVQFNDLEYASYEPGRVGHSEGIYVKSGLWQSEGINEAWCRLEGSNTQTGYDVIVLANYATRQFSAKVTDSRQTSGGITTRREFFVDRVERDINADARIRYQNQDFELEIDLRAFNGVTGKFRSSIRFEASGLDLRTDIACRISGELEVAN